jgi:hypothetical protein
VTPGCHATRPSAETVGGRCSVARIRPLRGGAGRPHRRE